MPGLVINNLSRVIGTVTQKEFKVQRLCSGALLPQDDLVDEVADIDTVPNVKKQHEVTAAISNSFGFGGHNSVVVFGPYKE